MADPVTPASLMAKADRACASARVLLGLGDLDGAANRAYYAMFIAARAALTASAAPVDPAISRTHGGLIAAFGLHLVKNGPVSREMGRLLNRAHEVRQVADYTGESVERAVVEMLVEQAEQFLRAMRAAFLSHSSG